MVRWFYLARRRPRRFHAQVTHVLVACVLHTDGTLSLGQRKEFLFDFVTVWDIAREALQDDVASWTLFPPVDVEDDTLSTVKLPEIDFDGDAGRAVWPGIVKRPRKPREEQDLDLGDRPHKRKAQRATTKGVTVLPPTQLSLLAVPAGAAVPPLPPPRRQPRRRRRGEPDLGMRNSVFD